MKTEPVPAEPRNNPDQARKEPGLPRPAPSAVTQPAPGVPEPRGGRNFYGGGYGGGNESFQQRRGGEGGDFRNRGPSEFGGRAFHGDHDRWRHEHFNGTWDFLVFPGPTFYPPSAYYAPAIPYGQSLQSHVAGVYVTFSGSDLVGTSFEGALGDRLRQGDIWAGSAGTASLELFIVSMDEDPADPGYGSAVSVSYILLPENQFLTAELLDVGRDQADALAGSVVNYANQLLDQYR